MSKYLSELKAIQRQYADLITSFDFSQVDDSFYYKAVDFIEKCEQFWTRKSEQLSIILNDLTSCSRCYVLEGAVYLDVKNQGQYEFVTLGDYHFLNDPFVKMRHFFWLGKSAVTDHCREYFIDAYNDTVSILKDYSEYLFFISLKVLCAHQFDEDIATGEKVYWDIISDALGKEYRSLDDLGADYHTIDEIENVMRPEVNKYFIFSGRSDANLSLKERVEKYYQTGQSMVAHGEQTDIQKFFYFTISLVEQAVHISLNCSQFNLHPFIRFEVVFHYLVLLLNCFSDEKSVASYLLDVITSYLISTYVIGDEIDSIAFGDYYSKCKNGKLTDKILTAIDASELGLSSFNLKKVMNDISNVYHSIFEK